MEEGRSGDVHDFGDGGFGDFFAQKHFDRLFLTIEFGGTKRAFLNDKVHIIKYLFFVCLTKKRYLVIIS